MTRATKSSRFWFSLRLHYVAYKRAALTAGLLLVIFVAVVAGAGWVESGGGSGISYNTANRLAREETERPFEGEEAAFPIREAWTPTDH